MTTKSTSQTIKTKVKSIASSEQTAIAKTLLTILPTFAKYLKSLDNDILNKAQYSYLGYRDTYNQVIRICDLIGSQDKLRLIKSRIEIILSRAPNLYEKVIYLYYKHRLSTSKIAVLLGVSQRSVFRYIAAALDWFAVRFDEVTTQESFTDLLRVQSWLRHIHNRTKKSAY